MGEPVKIVDLACNMIRLSGKEPRFPNDAQVGPRDIALRFVGSRPGEKLHEVLFGRGERDSRPNHPLISEVTVPPLSFDAAVSGLLALKPKPMKKKVGKKTG